MASPDRSSPTQTSSRLALLFKHMLGQPSSQSQRPTAALAGIKSAAIEEKYLADKTALLHFETGSHK